MKLTIVTMAAVALVAGTAMAQQVSETTKTTTTTTISPAEETQMRDYVVKEHRPAIPPPPGFVVGSGEVIPLSISLYRFPTERHWRYEYATIGDRTVLVDPDTRKIVTVIR